MITKTIRSGRSLLATLLAVVITLAPFSARALYEEEKAIEVGFSETVQVAGSSGAKYYMTSDKDQAVAFTVEGSEDDFGIFLYESDGRAIKGSRESDGNNSFTEYLAMKAGKRYMIDLVNWTGENKSVKFSVTESDFGVCVDREYSGKAGSTVEIKPFVITKADNVSYVWVNEQGEKVSEKKDVAYKFEGKSTYMYCYVYYGDKTGLIYISLKIENIIKITDTQIEVDYGGSAEAGPEITAYDLSGATIKWYESDMTTPIEGENGQTIKVENLTKNRYFIMSLVDKYGNEAIGGVTFIVDNHLTLSQPDPIVVKSGSDATITVTASGDDLENLKFRWYTDEDPETPICEKNKITIPNVTKTQYFHCTVEDRFGNQADSYCSVWVDNGFDLTTEQADYYINKGDSVELKVTAVANDKSGITYRWSSNTYKENGELDSSTYTSYDNDTDTLKLEKIEEPIMVFCTATDKFGSELGIAFEISFDADPNQGLKDFVQRIYTYVLDREPEAEGAKYWEKELYNFNRSGAEVAQGFIFSPEFEARNTTDEQFVTILYKTFFGREPDVAGMTYWLTMLQSATMDRPTVANGFIFSQEWADTCATYGIRSGGDIQAKVNIEPKESTLNFVERMYTTAMKRESDEEGKKYWASELANFRTTGEACGALFFLSDEMAALNLDNKEFVTRLYLTFMDREPDADGLKFWVDMLEQDQSRENAVFGFTRSEEFTNICIQSRILPY